MISCICLPANFILANEIQAAIPTNRIAAIASVRLNILSQEMHNSWRFPLIQLVLLTRILLPWIRKGIATAANVVTNSVTITRITTATNKGLLACERAIDRLVVHLDPLIMVATVITYIALFALGHTFIATIGFISITLIALQRFNCLPALITRLLQPLGLLSMLILSIITPAHLIVRIICIAISAKDLIDYARLISAHRSENRV